VEDVRRQTNAAQLLAVHDLVVTDAKLLARAEELQAEASDFLVAHDVEERLRATGSVLLVGSYVTGLMVWRDLDVCVDAAGLGRAEAWELVRPFVLEAERVRYEDIEEPGDCRHYFVLLLDGWKLDLSLFTDGIPPEVEAFQDELRRRLDDETRLAILRLKQLWHRRPEYPEVVGGFEICEAVLAGVRTNDELEAYLRQRALL
jgi:hypothetical protein